MKLGFICECRNQILFRVMDSHTFTKQAEKFKQMTARKLMATVLWDRKGVLMVKCVQQGTTLTSEVYCERKKKKTV
jgi:hypothetical protein